MKHGFPHLKPRRNLSGNSLAFSQGKEKGGKPGVHKPTNEHDLALRLENGYNVDVIGIIRTWKG
jgi:hypothetical protein